MDSVISNSFVIPSEAEGSLLNMSTENTLLETNSFSFQTNTLGILLLYLGFTRGQDFDPVFGLIQPAI